MDRLTALWRAIAGKPDPSIEELRGMVHEHSHRLDNVEETLRAFRHLTGEPE
jgi:hypothetical protein